MNIENHSNTTDFCAISIQNEIYIKIKKGELGAKQNSI